jgi:hypothetical protein
MERRMDQLSTKRAIAREEIREISRRMRRIQQEIEITCTKTRSNIAASHDLMRDVEEQTQRDRALIPSKT